MNTKKIQELIELMNANQLTEIEIEQDGTKIRILKGGAMPVRDIMAAHTDTQAKGREVTNAATQTPKEDKQKLIEIKSPMVGTFYRSPSPEADPYVQIGDIIHKGDILCIVEAMKLMNEVKSEVEGKIVNILIENTEPVEFGQVMFLIEPL